MVRVRTDFRPAFLRMVFLRLHKNLSTHFFVSQIFVYANLRPHFGITLAGLRLPGTSEGPVIQVVLPSLSYVFFCSLDVSNSVSSQCLGLQAFRHQYIKAFC